MPQSPYTTFRTKPKNQDEQPASPSEKDIRSRQIDELVKISEDARKDVYGVDHDETIKNFYNLQNRSRKTPTFRPEIRAPQLQVLLLSDAADLTDTSVRVFINHKKSGRDVQREKAFQEHWRQENFNYHMLMAQVYSEFSGTSFLQVGYDPAARKGEGSVWMRGRLQQGIYVDPISPWPEDWSFVVIEDPIYLDQAKELYGAAADNIRPRTARTEAMAGPAAGGVEMPPGPMSTTVRGLPGGDHGLTDGILKRRTLYARDSTLRTLTDAEKKEFENRNLPVPEYLKKYPNGRMIVDCEGTIVVDGDSWVPLDLMFPIVPVWATPPWDSVWCPAPMKFTKSLQDNAERLMTQTFENAYRLNNGVVIINEVTGLTADTVGGLPGELLVIAANSPAGSIEIKYPPPMPQQMTELPITYLKLQRELQGFSGARQGQTGAGNVSADLFESAVSQSQSITKLRARLFSYSVQKAAELAFYTMAKFYTNQRVFYSNKKRQEPMEVTPKRMSDTQVEEGAA